MLTKTFLAKENQKLKADYNSAITQLEAACEALGNIRANDRNLFHKLTKDTNFSRKEVSRLLGV
ncbi:MAG: hypothetical protein ACN2B6_01205 [Rickettsiales bacterium]